MYHVAVAFGAKLLKLMADNDLTLCGSDRDDARIAELCDSTKGEGRIAEHIFSTRKERAAYMKGISDCTGFRRHSPVEYWESPTGELAQPSLSYQELSTLLAALRHWQSLHDDTRLVIGELYFLDTEPLDDAGMNELAQRLYTLELGPASESPGNILSSPDWTGLAHEIWALAQLTPGEGIEDGAQRIETRLREWPRYIQLVGRGKRVPPQEPGPASKPPQEFTAKRILDAEETYSEEAL